jgi:hypothetical protein
MFFQLGALALGSTVYITKDEADNIATSFPISPSFDEIIVHNIRVSAFGFLPIFGVGWMGFVGFNTGIAMKAIAMNRQEPTSEQFFTMTAFPHYWLEDFAYSIALTSGLMFLLALFTLKTNVIFHEIKCSIFSIIAWAFLLTFAGLLEVFSLFSNISWLIIVPLAVILLEMTQENQMRPSRIAVFLITLILYLSLMQPLLVILFVPNLLSSPFYAFPITIYVFVGYYLFETLSNGWLRRQFKKFLGFIKTRTRSFRFFRLFFTTRFLM